MPGSSLTPSVPLESVPSAAFSGLMPVITLPVASSALSSVTELVSLFAFGPSSWNTMLPAPWLPPSSGFVTFTELPSASVTVTVM